MTAPEDESEADIENEVRQDPAGTVWCLSLALPAACLPTFEAALESLGGALDSGAPEPGDAPLQLRLYLDAPPERAALGALLAAAAEACGIATPDVALDALAPRDWVAESQAALPPIRTNRFWVHGSHDKGPPPAGCWPLLIEAAGAFGTGRHETTLGCLRALEGQARSRNGAGRGFARVLDMGCGSGILALAAARLWPAARVLGIDNDPVAVAVARGNARINRLARVTFARNDGYRAGGMRLATRGEGGRFDLVTANILARPLAAMAPDLRRALAPGGVAVLAGLLRSQERQVMAPHEAQGLRLARRIVLGDWSILVLRG